MTHTLSRFASGIAAVAALAGVTLLPAPALAWGHFGVFVGLPPVVVGPPVAAYPPYYYPPGYYAPGYPYPYAYPYAYPYGYPPPAAAAAPQSSAPAQGSAPQMSQADTPYGSTCYAGAYVCGAAPQSHVGSVCSCPGIGAPSYGTVR
jgi:hypothetical protein